METASEIRSILNNIRFYSKKLEELAKQQFNKDCEIGQVVGINPEPGGVRFNCLGAIGAATKWIETYCDNIEVNVKSAEEQDQKLRPLPEETEEETEEIEEHEQEAITPEEFR